MQKRQVFQRQFWREFRIDVLRARKDPRARKSLLLRLLFFLYLIGVIAYYSVTFYSFHDATTAIGMAAILVIVLAIIASVKISQSREIARQARADISSIPKDQTARVQRLAHGLAAITERALGEAWLTRNAVPKGHSAITRRITIDALRRHGAWDEMPVGARKWMMQPDGSWPPIKIATVLQQAETLNTLLWSLALIDNLRPVEDFLETLQLQKLARALKRPAAGIRPTWDMRLERNRAYEYFWRCYAEGIHRGDFESTNDEQRAAVQSWIEEIASNPGADYLAGASTIGELDVTKLRHVAMSAVGRANTLRLLMEVLDGNDVWAELSVQVYGSETDTAGDEILAE